MNEENVFVDVNPTEQPEQPTEQPTSQPEQPTGQQPDSTGQPTDATWYNKDSEFAELAGKYKTPDDMLKDFANAQKLIGKKTIGALSPDATPEEVDKFYEALGRPKTPAEYNILEEGQDAIVDMEQFNKLAFETGLTEAQAKTQYKAYASILEAQQQEVVEQSKLQAKACLDTLKEQFGDKSNDIRSRAIKSAQELGILDLLKENPSVANNPNMLIALSKLTKSAPQVIDADLNNNLVSSIEKQIADLRADPEYYKDTLKAQDLNRKALELYAKL